MTKEAAFAEAYTAHYRQVRGLCRQLLGSTERAEDAAQEALVAGEEGDWDDQVLAAKLGKIVKYISLIRWTNRLRFAIVFMTPLPGG